METARRKGKVLGRPVKVIDKAEGFGATQPATAFSRSRDR
jgi:hypothetical protein